MKITLQTLKDFFAKKEYTEKIKAKEMTEDDWKSLNAAFKEEFQVDLNEALENAKASKETEEKVEKLTAEKQEALAALYADKQPDTEKPEPEAKVDTGNGEAKADTGKGEANLTEEINKLKKEVETLRSAPEPKETESKTPEMKKKPSFLGMGPADTKKYAFGIPAEMFSMDKPWNQRTMNRLPVAGRYDTQEAKQLEKEFSEYAKAFGNRYEEVKANGMLPAIVAGSIDYTDLESDLGAYYRVRRMDEIITFVQKLPTIRNIFPLRSNVQDEEVITNSFEGSSFSQPFQKGKVVSGSFTFQPDKAKMADVMFKHEFSDLKQLEKEYIGYLNKEGSSPFKWSFVEWILTQCATIQHNEREERWLKGIRVEPTTDSPAHYLYGSTGILNDLDNRKEVKKQIYVLSGSKTYTSSTIVAYVESFVNSIFEMLGQRMKKGHLVMNMRHSKWFLQNFRDTYGTDLDFDGEKLEIKNFDIPIRLVDMGAQRYDLWFQPEGAYEVLENKPGEFYEYATQTEWESIYFMSYAKEGVFAFAGRQYDTKEALQAAKGKHTNIFANHPVTELAADATTADATVNEMFQTVENTGATALTDIENAVEGVAYKVVCGNTTNATTIAQAGKFSTITGAYTPTAVGDYIKVIYDPTAEKFHEIERVVGGTRTVNTSLKAPAFTE